MVLTEEPIEPAQLFRHSEEPEVGAVAVFLGVVRNHHHGRAVSHLFYESYRPMAEREIERLVSVAHSRWPLRDIFIRHRIGTLGPGETAVAIAVRSDHRAEAFEACRFLIDEIKRTVPIWKRETYADGATEWVGCEHQAAEAVG